VLSTVHTTKLHLCSSRAQQLGLKKEGCIFWEYTCKILIWMFIELYLLGLLNDFCLLLLSWNVFWEYGCKFLTWISAPVSFNSCLWNWPQSVSDVPSFVGLCNVTADCWNINDVGINSISDSGLTFFLSLLCNNVYNYLFLCLNTFLLFLS
jgi:hypothetical protein